MQTGSYCDPGETTRHVPLSLRFETQELWPAIRREIGGDETVAAVCLALSASDRPVSYSRNRNHYRTPRRYSEPLYTYRRITSAMDLLDGKELIDHDRAERGRLGWQSSAFARPELRQLVAAIARDGTGLVAARPRETIILRDAAGRPIDYNDDASTRRWRRNLDPINEMLRHISTTVEVRSQMRRIFNRCWDQGGRFYAIGGGWQCLSKAARRELRLDGEPVVEIDYRNYHPTILYSWAEKIAPEDCYIVCSWPRKLVKVSLLVLINATTLRQAIGAIARHDAMAEIAERGSSHAFQCAHAIVQDIKKIHAPIEEYFHSNVGVRLMRLDAEIAERVLLKLVSAGCAILPVHDSFIVAKSNADLLAEAMVASAEEHGVKAVKIHGA